MKIGIDISQIIYGTGVSTYSENLVKSLIKNDRKNQYVLFASTFRLGKKLRDLQDELTKYKNVEFRFYKWPHKLLEFLWGKYRLYSIENFIGEVDIFHSSDWLQPPLKSKKTKKVTTVHDMVAFLFASTLPEKIIYMQKKRMEHVKKEVDLIIADSLSTKEDIIKFLEINSDDIAVVPLAVSLEFNPQDEDKINAVLEKYKIKKPYILSVGTQEPRKNIRKLIDVFEKISQQKQDIKLVLTGKKGWGESLYIPENVINTGYVSKDELICLYSGCRMFVYPSLYEGFGLPVLEAMACGAPVITSNNSSMAEIAKDVAILVDPRSEGQLKKAIEMVLDLNLENYQAMVRASLERARKYTWTKTAKETLAVYENLYMNQKRDTDKETKEKI